MTLPVNERFYTFQGEGVHMGRAAFFIRLHGCPLHCPWCDSAGTWHPNYIPKNVLRMDPLELAKEARESGAPFVVVTGGEPAIHDLNALCNRLQDDIEEDETVIPCHIETSGAFPLKGGFSFVTVSPKRAKLPVADTLFKADEIKIIVDTDEAIEEWHDWLEESYFPYHKKNAPIWLHPEWSKSKDPEILKRITQAVKEYPHLYRAGLQMHKYYRADNLDNRTQPPAPLGGDLNKGY